MSVMVCVTGGFGLTKGKHYKILNEVQDCTEGDSSVSVISDNGTECVYYINRFITHEKWKDSLINMLESNTKQDGITLVQEEFIPFDEDRKFAQTIHALREKLNSIKDGELSYQRKKLSKFDEEQAELISNRIIQNVIIHFVKHLKECESMDKGIEWIEKIFQLEKVN